MSTFEEGHILFLELAVMFKMKKKNQSKIKYWVPEFLSKQEEKGPCSNLTRSGSSWYGAFFR